MSYAGEVRRTIGDLSCIIGKTLRVRALQILALQEPADKLSDVLFEIRHSNMETESDHIFRQCRHGAVATTARRLSTATNFGYAGHARRGSVKWPITQSLNLQFRVARTARPQTMPSQLDSAGQAILNLLHKAAGTAEANSRKALETAQKLSSQLHSRTRSYRRTRGPRSSTIVRRLNALKIGYAKFLAEIEDRLINQPEEKRRQVSRRI